MSSAKITFVSAPTSKSPPASCRTTRSGCNSSWRCCAAAFRLKRPERSRAATICASSAPRSAEPNAPSPLHIELLAQMIADLHDHRHAFGIAGLLLGCLVGRGSEFPGIPGGENGDHDSVRTVEMNLELSPRHRHEFGFGPGGLAHGGGFLSRSGSAN